MTFAPVPGPGPVLVGPHEKEREVGLFRAQDLVERALEQPSAAEPVMVIGEATEAGSLRQRGLEVAHFGNSEVVETEVSREVRLMVAPKLRSGLGHVGPLREPRAPPVVVLRDGVVLR
jgi:hypothetical protein